MKPTPTVALSIIFTNRIEARIFNKTHELNQEYDTITTSVSKRSDKADESGRNDTVLMKKMCTHCDQRNDTNAESRDDILSRNEYNHTYKHKDNEEAHSEKPQAEQQSDDNHKSNTAPYLPSLGNRKHFGNVGTCCGHNSQVNSVSRKLVAEAMAHTIAIEKVKQEGETKLEINDLLLQDYLEKENHQTVKPVQRKKQLTARYRNTKIRTTQANRENQLTPKITHNYDTGVEDEISKTRHCDYKNDRSFEKISREHDAYKLKRRDGFKIASKHHNKKKVNENNMKVKQHFIKRQRTFKTSPRKHDEYKIKHRDIETPALSNTISMENDYYQQKHINDFATVEEPVSKQVNPEYKPQFSHNFQKKKQRDKKVTKVRHTHKTKHNSKKKDYSEEVISNQEKHKQTLNKNRYSVSETHTDIRKSKHERSTNSGDISRPDDAGTQTVENQDEKETLDSYEELLIQKDLQNKPKLPFYVSSSTKRAIKEIFKIQPKKLVAQKNEKETDKLLGDLNTIFKQEKDLRAQNTDLNTTINRLATWQILDFITDRVAGQMLKKLEKSQAKPNWSKASENRLRTDPEMVEQIDILFEGNGDMVMTGREHFKDKEEDEIGLG